MSYKTEVLENRKGEGEERNDSCRDGKDGRDTAIVLLSLGVIFNSLAIIFLALKF